MKIFISVDMEGISGLVSWKEMLENKNVANKYMLEDLKAVIKGILDSQEKIDEITVVDSHALGRNLDYEAITSLDERITLIRGFPRLRYMVEGLDESYDKLFLVGYHAMIGEVGLMDHSYSSSCITNLELNGKRVGEATLNAFYSHSFGVPLVFVSGDDILEKEIKENFKEVEFVRTKEAISRYAAKCYPVSKVRKELYEKAKIAARKEMKPTMIEKPYCLKVEFVSTTMADAASVIPGVKRITGKKVELCTDDFVRLYEIFMLMILSCYALREIN